MSDKTNEGGRWSRAPLNLTPDARLGRLCDDGNQ